MRLEDFESVAHLVKRRRSVTEKLKQLSGAGIPNELKVVNPYCDSVELGRIPKSIMRDKHREDLEEIDKLLKNYGVEL